MNKDGRITISKLTLELLQGKEEGLVGYALEIQLEPARALTYLAPNRGAYSSCTHANVA